MVLNTCAARTPSAAAASSASPPLARTPTALRRDDAGSHRIRASSNAGIPMPRGAATHRIGTRVPAWMPDWRPATSASGANSPSSRNVSVSRSSVSATASTSRSRAARAVAVTSEGRVSSATAPDGVSAVIVTRSMTPLNDPAAPIGHWTGMAPRPNRSATPSTTRGNAACSRSSRDTTTTRLNRSRSARLHTLSVWTSTPAVASTATSTLSTARRAPTTSPMKSGYPGVSMRLSLVSCHSRGASAALTVIFLRISSASKSVVVVPSSTRPWRSTALAAKSIASTNDVFPVPPCPATATFRIRSAG